MAESGDASVLDCQVKACKALFVDELPHGFEPMAEKDRPDNTKQFKGPVYDITHFDAHQVVAVLSDIVNDRNQFTSGKTFYLLIRSSSEDNSKVELEELSRLKANPSNVQPGNGIVLLRPRGKIKFTERHKTYDALNGALEGSYPTNEKLFAKDIKQLFEDNAQNKDIPQATFEAYIILLFEVARRSVKSEKQNDKKEEYDVLPIGSAIARFIKLLELGNCRIKDVFLPREKFHCFSGKPEVRRKAIEEINLAMPTTEEETVTKEKHLKELKELFCSEKRLEEQLAKQLKGLNMLIRGETSSSSSTSSSTSSSFSSDAASSSSTSSSTSSSFSSDAENHTAFDHCE